MPPTDPGIWSERELSAQARAIAEYALRRYRDALRMIDQAERMATENKSYALLLGAGVAAARAVELAKVLQFATGDPAWLAEVLVREAQADRLRQRLVTGP